MIPPVPLFFEASTQLKGRPSVSFLLRGIHPGNGMAANKQGSATLDEQRERGPWPGCRADRLRESDKSRNGRRSRRSWQTSREMLARVCGDTSALPSPPSPFERSSESIPPSSPRWQWVEKGCPKTCLAHVTTSSSSKWFSYYVPAHIIIVHTLSQLYS